MTSSPFRPLVVTSLVCLSSFLLPPSSFSQEWTRFRGPNGSGISQATTIPVQWTAKDYRWNVKLPGVGHSSPVIWGDRVFVTSATEADATQIVLCLRTTDGSQVWRREFPSTTYRKNAAAAFASATPALDSERVYVAWATPTEYIVLALSQKDGSDVWRRDLGPFASEHGFGASPIVWKDLVIVPNDQDKVSFVAALDCKTGQSRWQAKRQTAKASFSTPCLFEPKDGKPQLILSSWSHGLTSLDPETGKQIWDLPVFHNNRIVGSPMIAEGLIFAAAGVGGGGREMVAVQPGDPDRSVEAKVAYKVQGLIPYVPTPVAKGTLLFLWRDNGVVACIDAPTGKRLWEERVGGEYFGSPVRVGDRLYCISKSGEMVVLAAADRYQLLARVPLGEKSHATPAVADGVMYLRTISHLMALGGASAPKRN
jgi:outer membrane protein assembly factor BamB